MRAYAKAFINAWLTNKRFNYGQCTAPLFYLLKQTEWFFFHFLSDKMVKTVRRLLHSNKYIKLKEYAQNRIH